MIKQLLFSSLLLLPCAQSMAQEFKLAHDVTMYNSSENGKYACASKEGIIYLWNTEKDDDVVTLQDQYYYCDCVSNDGVMAGSVGPMGAEKPALISANNITYLPMPEDKEWTYGSARGITSDGKMVCGLLSDASVNIMDNATPILPFVWEIDGDKITCTELPFPEKDYTGRCPQGFHPLMVAESKNRILGREIDFSGMGGVFIVWERTAPGEPWTYKVLGEDIIYKDGPDFPEYPDEPTRVNYEDYMTADELEAYNKAYDKWWNGEILGDAPDPADYITDPDKREAYIEDYNKYLEEQTDYMNKIYAFLDVYYQRRSEYTFGVYSFAGSFNGRYLGCRLQKDDTSTGFPTSEYYPCYYDLDDNYKYISLEEDRFKDHTIGTRITDNGDILVVNPASPGQYTPRNSRVIPAGQSDPVTLYDFLGSKNDGKVNRQSFVEAGLELSWESIDPDTYETIEIQDSLVVGSVFLSADGKNAVGATTDPNLFTYTSWALNSFNTTGISTAKVHSTEAVLRSNVIENGMIEFVADVKKATLYDLSGATLYSGTPAGSSIAAPAKEGIYVLQSKLRNGAVRTDKIVVR